MQSFIFITAQNRIESKQKWLKIILYEIETNKKEERMFE